MSLRAEAAGSLGARAGAASAPKFARQSRDKLLLRSERVASLHERKAHLLEERLLTLSRRQLLVTPFKPYNGVVIRNKVA